MYRLMGDNHMLDGLPFSAQVFLRALDGVRSRLAIDANVSGVELRALSRIAEEARITPEALGEHLELSRVAVAGVIDDLVERGMIVPDDPSRSLELTAAGHDLIERVYLQFQDSINTAADSLDDDRKFAFSSAMLKIARKLDDSAVGL